MHVGVMFKIIADDILFFKYFPEIIRLGISCESSAKQTIHKECQVLFSLKNTKKKKKNQCDVGRTLRVIFSIVLFSFGF